jgi:L-glyceraldehyde 3-phosphate reductase
MVYKASSDRYDQMPYNRCGRSGLLLPQISLGLWHNFGDVDPFEKSRSMIRRAFDLGITHFDLANNYGPSPGSAESTFGEILKKDLMPHRDEIIVSTKAGYYMWPGPYGEWGSKKYLISSLDQSLKRMNLQYVDIFYSHRPDPETPLEETMEALAQAVRSGKALYAGISNYSAEQTERAYEILHAMGVRCLIHQVRYSMFSREPEKELFRTLAQLKMGCIVFSPLAQGLLTDRYLRGIPKNSRASKPYGFLKKSELTEEVMQKVVQLNSLAQNRGQTLAQMAIEWVLRRDEVTSALIGASSVGQLESNIRTEPISFDQEELRWIEKILR